MPKVAHTTIFEYKNRITSLESEVSTLKRRLDELRRAKHQVYCKQQQQAVRLKTDGEPPPPPPPGEDLAQQVTRLQNLLELSELKYTRDTGTLRATIKQLQSEISALRDSHNSEVQGIMDKHYMKMEMLKKSHTEELALYTETSERHQAARQQAEEELNEFRQKRSIQPEISLLKSELARLQSAYAARQLAHAQEVAQLEERLAELISEIASRNERRRFQLIPDRTYIVKKTASPSVSATSIGSVSKTSSASPPSEEHATEIISKVSENCQSVTCTNENQKLENCKTDKIEPVDKSPYFSRPKSCTTRKSLQKKPVLMRPKSCWSDPNKRSDVKRPIGNSSSKFSAVSSKIDSGRVLPPDPIMKYKAVRNGALGSSVPPWQNIPHKPGTINQRSFNKSTSFR